MNGQAEGLARRILESRTKKGWSQQELGQRLDPPVSGATISRWENGLHTPTSEHLSSLIALFGWLMHPDEFLQDVRNGRVRRRLAQAAGDLEAGDGRRAHVGTHTVELLEDGSLLVNGKVRVQPE